MSVLPVNLTGNDDDDRDNNNNNILLEICVT